MVDLSKLKRIFVSFNPNSAQSRSAREVLKSLLTPKVSTQYPNLKIEYQIRSDAAPSVMEVAFSDGRNLNVGLDSVSKEQALGRIQTALKDSEFRDLLKQGKLEKQTFHDRWDAARGRPPKDPNGPPIPAKNPIRSIVNPLTYYGPSGERKVREAPPSGAGRARPGVAK